MRDAPKIPALTIFASAAFVAAIAVIVKWRFQSPRASRFVICFAASRLRTSQSRSRSLSPNGLIPNPIPRPNRKKWEPALLIPHPALMRRRNLHILTVLGHRTAGNVDAFPLKHRGDLLIGERLNLILVIDHLLHLALQNQ